jgi:hypothetical protein
MASVTEAPAAPRSTSPKETACVDAIFQQPWWLEAVAPGHWGEVRCEHGGQVVARLPYVVRGRPRLRMLTQSSLPQTLGPWVEPSGARAARALGREHELLAELEARLPPAAAFSQQFSPAVHNALPFYWAGYRLEFRYTYRLEDLRSQEALWSGLRGSVRRDPQSTQACGGRPRPRRGSLLPRGPDPRLPGADRPAARAAAGPSTGRTSRSGPPGRCPRCPTSRARSSS